MKNTFPLGKSVGKKEAQTKAGIVLDSVTDQLKPEVNVTGIAQNMGISIIYHDLNDKESGMLVVNDEDKAVIVVNENHSAVRQRFTIAHELGHYLLHYAKGQQIFHRSIKSSEGTEPQEIDANAFAAALLMPENEVRKLILEIDDDMFDDAVDELILEKARELNVSTTALTYRIEGFKKQSI